MFDSVLALLTVVPLVFGLGVEGLQEKGGMLGMIDIFRRAGVWGWVTVALGSAFLVSSIVLLGTRGQTLGKIVAGTRIVALDGSRVGFLRAVFLRGVLPTLCGRVPVVGPFFGLVDTLMIFGKDKRCLHDQMAGTKVVKVSEDDLAPRS